MSIDEYFWPGNDNWQVKSDIELYVHVPNLETYHLVWDYSVV